jgi:hypothetical protein
MDEKELDQKIEALANASAKARDDMVFLAEAINKMGLRGVEAKKKLIEMAVGVDKVTVAMKKSAVDIKQSMDALKKSINKGEVSSEELTDQLNTLRDQINKTSDQGKKQALLDAKADLEAMNARNQANAALKDSLWNMAGVLTVGAANAFKGATTKALSGADAFDIAGSMMTAGVDLVNTANQGGANALKSFGAATAGAGGKMGWAGAAASVLGEGLSAASVGLSELAKAGIGFMLAQTKQLIAGFQTLSSVGAVYNGGMMAMVNTSLRAGMTMEQFSKSVSANSDNLARTGLGVAEASKRMAGAMDGTSKAGIAARKGMFALGMGMEEQVDAFANTMARMAGPLGQLRASDKEVAQATQEYAKNLKMVSAITGEDAKAKQEKIRQEQDNLWMDGQLASMSAEQRESWNAMMLSLNEDDRRAVIERKKYGGVISKDIAGGEALVPAVAKMRDRALRMALDAHSTTADGYRMQEQFAKDTQRQGLSVANTVGIANSETAISMGKTVHNSIKSAALTSEGAEKLAAAAIERQNKAGKAGTDEGANNLEMLQSNMVEMQSLAVANMDQFQKALKMSYDAAMWAVRGLGSLGTAAANNPIKTGILAILPAIVGTIGPLLLTKMFGGKFGVLGASAANPMHVTGGGFGGPGAGGGVDKNGRYRDSKGRFAKAPTAMSTLKSAGALGKIAGVTGAIVGTAMAVGDIYDTENDKTLTKGQKREKEGSIVGSAAGGAAGAWAGATAGAAIGAFGGPLGIAVGGLIGGALGYWGGSEGGEKLGKAIMKDESATSKVAAATSVAVSGATTQTTTPKPVTSSSQNLAAEQIKLYGAVVDPEAAKKAATEKPVASANPAEQQQINLLQTILATLQKSNNISSGILQNSY